METDTEKLIPTYKWDKEVEKIKNIEKDILEIVYKINQDDNENLNNLDKKKYTEEIKNKMKNVKELLDNYEKELTNSEVKGDSSEVIKKREDQFILLSKEYERIENIANIDALGESDYMDELLNSNERSKFISTNANLSQDENEEDIYQLQEILLDEQDKNLDLLADVIERHKEIGIAINNEIDAQINLIETTEDDLENTQQRLDRTRRRINQAGEYHELISCRLIIIIIILLLMLIAIKYSF